MNINARIKATNNSIALIKTIRGVVAKPTANDLNKMAKQTKLNTKICPAVIFANKRIIKAKGLVNIPIIASGGAGNKQDFADAFLIGNADAALAASVFHFGEIEIPELKQFLKQQNIPVRI